PRCFKCYNRDVKRLIFTGKDTHRINSPLSNYRHAHDFGIHIDTRLAEHQYVSKINQIQKYSNGTVI
ncbi:MAG TPA: hypothetical protein VFI64_02105, partial [Nitrososphaeraceae archaeon]|nr:hypothetical protein [Nitrososphaeraceae archaeon]